MSKNPDIAVAKRILLVDDERLVRETIKLLLARIGFTVVEANNGAEALGLFARERFDLVVTDYEMPFVKGNELAAQIRRLAPRQPILMLTGFGHNANRGNPVNAVLDKPLNFGRLQEIVHQLLTERHEGSSEGYLPELNQFN
jgi:CheY-like chemotaxis protein